MASPIVGKQKSEEYWKAENDARTLVDAEAIKADEPRMKKAQAAAKKMLDEEQARAEAMKKIAGAKMTYNKSPKEG